MWGLHLPRGCEHLIPQWPILSRSSVIGAVTSSAAESELAAALMNAREAVYLRNILEACGHPQQKTPIVTDNAFVFAVVNGTCKAKRSRAMDMRYHWLRDRVGQAQFEVVWRGRSTSRRGPFRRSQTINSGQVGTSRQDQLVEELGPSTA
jgi:hypothetical protein